ncbi:MAG: YdgA family protein [Gammaproteobacteria bacterium]|nr:YdgA family protein [Gammaproteobacteria bacterium]
MSKKRISFAEIFLWFVALLLVLLVVSPIALGFKIKNDYRSMLAEIASLTHADIEIVSYNRGFFSSDVVLRVGVKNTPLTFQFKENIVHGPVYLGLINQGKMPFVIAVATGEMLPHTQFAAQINQLFAGKSPLVYQNIINLNGNVISEGYMPAVNAALSLDKDKVTIQTSGITIQSEFHQQSGKLTGDIVLPAMSMATSIDNMQLQGLNLNYSGVTGQNGLLIGDSVLALKLLDYYSNGSQLSVRTFNMRAITSEQDQLLNSQLVLKVQEILTSNIKIGPVDFNLKINGLNAIKIIELQDLQEESEQQVKDGIPVEQAMAEYTGKIMGLLPDLFKESEITINPLKIDSDIGALLADLVFSIDDLDTTALVDPLFILNSINLDINLKVDENLLPQLIRWQLASAATVTESPSSSSSASGDGAEVSADADDTLINQMIQVLQKEGWLKRQDQSYQGNLSFHQGVMLLNGKEIDPVAYFMSQMTQPAP